ncbi:DUF305 domain-containing protein [Micromonospora sp. WMMD736]|uniref:DUF305 domain-containing protein n=1 Tax=Micromonospora sp. WMMD736 TaxID=3404112 RepID=UPI003B93D78C
MTLRTRIVAVLAAPAAVLSMVACSDTVAEDHTAHETATTAPLIADAPAGFNDADVTFVTTMVQHHAQAVDLAALVPDRSSNPDVVALAERIRAAQEPEIEAMRVLLVQWREGEIGAGHGDHGDAMPGMVDDATMTELQSLRGTAFDTLWLESMISHHEGAIEMANAELADGENVDAIALATTIVATQQAEIDQMAQMLGG